MIACYHTYCPSNLQRKNTPWSYNTEAKKKAPPAMEYLTLGMLCFVVNMNLIHFETKSFFIEKRNRKDRQFPMKY
jgi:hypothetical protein